MILLYILLGIILLFTLIFSLHLKFYIRIDGETTIRAGLGPVVLKLAPKKQKTIDLADFSYEKHAKRLEKERKRAARKAQKKSEKDAKNRQQKELAAKAEKLVQDTENSQGEGKLASVIEIISFVFEELPKFISYFKAEIRLLDITVGGKDADDIARKYGKISALVSLLVELLDNKTQLKKLKPKAIDVRADFIAEKLDFRLDIRIKLRLFSILRVGFHALKWLIGQKIKQMKSKQISA